MRARGGFISFADFLDVFCSFYSCQDKLEDKNESVFLMKAAGGGLRPLPAATDSFWF